jgi:hypothetical protein
MNRGVRSLAASTDVPLLRFAAEGGDTWMEVSPGGWSRSCLSAMAGTRPHVHQDKGAEGDGLARQGLPR